MKPVNTGGHAAYQKLVLEQLCKYYPNASSSLDASTWEIMEQFSGTGIDRGTIAGDSEAVQVDKPLADRSIQEQPERSLWEVGFQISPEDHRQ